VKKSGKITLVLLGTLSAGALTACAPGSRDEQPISANNVYPNNYFVAGAGYYHAPFHGFYPLPYNHYDASNRLYYFGGQRAAVPFRSVINLSSPTPEAAARAQSAAVIVQRNGFGRTSSSFHIWS